MLGWDRVLAERWMQRLISDPDARGMIKALAPSRWHWPMAVHKLLDGTR